MRISIIAAVATIGLSFVGISGASAAPASGIVINDTAAASRLTQNVRDYDHHRKICRMPHGIRHCY
jgi:hypothetical protein